MAVSPKINPCCSPDRKSLRVYDITREQTAQNTGGWGGTNPAATDATASTLTITLPDGTVTSAINVLSILPNIDGLYFAITNVMLGLGLTDLVPDGEYNFLWNISGTGPFTASQNVFKLIVCNAECCVEKLSAKWMSDNSKKSKQAKKDYSDAYDLLENAKNAARCGKREEAKQFLAELQLFCDNLGCACGCND